MSSLEEPQLNSEQFSTPEGAETKEQHITNKHREWLARFLKGSLLVGGITAPLFLSYVAVGEVLKHPQVIEYSLNFIITGSAIALPAALVGIGANRLLEEIKKDLVK